MQSSRGRRAASALSALLLAAGCVAQAADGIEQLRETLRKEAGEGCEVRDTAHWLIVSKADPKWVDAAAKMLERTHDLFFEQFKKAGFEPQPLREKLVCVLFGEPDGFAKYLERVRGSGGERPAAEAAPSKPPSRSAGTKRPSGLGSYSERTNRIQMCDIHAIARRPARLDDPAEAELQNVVRIAHEAVHQLSFNSGILKRDVGYPMWLGEGLAANFEFSDPGKPFGPLTENLSPRAARLKRLHAEGKVMPLKQLITMSPAEARQADNKGPSYVQGWGLVRFLFTERPKQLRQYLALLADRPRGPQRRSEVLATFERAFGPVDELEKPWQEFLKRIPEKAAVGESRGAMPSLVAARTWEEERERLCLSCRSTRSTGVASVASWLRHAWPSASEGSSPSGRGAANWNPLGPNQITKAK